MSLIIIASSVFLYALFWVWYVGFGRKASPELIARALQALDQHGGHWTSDTHRNHIRQLLENDDGKEFIMVNLLTFKRPRKQSYKLLNQYYQVFGKSLLKRAGHPIVVASSASGKIEFLGVPVDEEWDMAGLMRYRSRSDFAEIVIATAGSEHHDFKLQALERTIAFPASPSTLIGSPRVLVALILALLASLLHIALV
ncbi:hypothetical protein BST96_14565 [Oceanicoccus sagamiensis]|uniref:Uncharacterized protein n=2 Tax=Oceanicoccus sagamiensis TaxID=716816 RepID=A0A1X9NB02_9GAMM|nr:hypothetical protein BST96_14565 [Oceanicoccus sagamiensis]